MLTELDFDFSLDAICACLCSKEYDVSILNILTGFVLLKEIDVFPEFCFSFLTGMMVSFLINSVFGKVDVA